VAGRRRKRSLKLALKNSHQGPVDQPREKPTLGIVETDRFCDECGYNLRTQCVFRDTATNLLLVRCPECARVHPANQLSTVAKPWLKRFATLALFGWMVFLLVVAVMACMGELGLHIAIYEQLTHSMGNRRVYRPWNDDEDFGLIATLGAISAVIGFIEITLLAISAHHWRRWGYVLIAVLLPSVPLAMVMFGISRDGADMLPQAMWRLLLHWGLQVCGGIVAALLGRPFARLLAWAFVPPKPRATLAYLWLADGKTPPGKKQLAVEA
jgi:hypothetical protein